MTDTVLPDANAVYFDGTSNRKRRVTLRLRATLEVVENGRTVATWPFAAIRSVDAPHQRLRLRNTEALPLARIDVEDAALAQALVSRCPSLHHDRGGSQKTVRIVAWSLAAACSLVAVAYFGIPVLADRLAPFVPAKLEQRIGDAVDGQVRAVFDGKTCTGTEGRLAFKVLVDKLQRAGGLETPIEAEVLSSSIPNAVALPGGKIYLLDGLLKKARTPDEIAGVIAHELGHVHNRDNLRRIIQTGGTSFLIGLLFGDVMGGSVVIFAARTMLNASYSRDAETQADEFAIAVMRKLGRPSRSMGELLVRVSPDSAGKNLSLFASHPMSDERLATMREADRPQDVAGAELLTSRQWQALKAICDGQRSGGGVEGRR